MGLFVRPVKRYILGRRNRICARTNRYAQALYLSAGMVTSKGCHEYVEVGLAELAKGVVGWVCDFEEGYIQ